MCNFCCSCYRDIFYFYKTTFFVLFNINRNKRNDLLQVQTHIFYLIQAMFCIGYKRPKQNRKT